MNFKDSIHYKEKKSIDRKDTMSDQPKQPTILVKKSDGTSVRVTLDEFKNMKARGMTSPAEASKNVDSASDDLTTLSPDHPITRSPDHLTTLSPDHLTTRSLDHVGVVENDLPMVPEEPGLPATTTPVVDAFVNEAASAVAEQSTAVLHRYEAPVREEKVTTEEPSVVPQEEASAEIEKAQPAWTPKDHESPLEESVRSEEIRTKAEYTVPSPKEDVVEQVIAGLSFAISATVLGRAKALIQSRAKDVRNDQQVRRYATQTEAGGGLGLTEAQAEELVARIHTVLGIKPETAPYVSVQAEVQKKAVKESATTKPAEPVQSTPATPDALDALIRAGAGETNILATYKKTPAAGSVAEHTPRGIPSVSAQKPMMHDVTPPTPETMGPIDELRAFSLTDFRRLGGTLEQKKLVILGKFETLKRDSFVLYMQGREAWYQSPLYRQYLQIIARSVNERKPVSTVIGSLEGDHLVEEEFAVVAGISSNLNT